MGIKPDTWIKDQAEQGMIEPFFPYLVQRDGNGRKIFSWGLSSCGYDIRLHPHMKMVDYSYDGRIDPFYPRVPIAVDTDPEYFKSHPLWVDLKGPTYWIPARTYVLGSSIEYIRVPKGVVGLIYPKSSYLRMGLAVHGSPLEPGWEGTVTLHIANHAHFPVKVYPGQGIAQIVFMECESEPEIGYGDREEAKYQGQRGVTLGRVGE